MDATRADLLMRVEGMTCDGCAAAVIRTVKRLDPGAEVQVDRAAGRVAIRTDAQALAVADALTKAGYTATAMTG
ncbi:MULTISPECIES: heavy-metal-associated domain-containing protein [unclassified Methylobacterium]|jgi:copper chaperone|uniref:heavy-metal-associated domain-containing protein n=1 Tax=unclassified Methylobacterium TaxID=2615210 RepID=UPI0013525F77|nr:heavy-metal-associated domain-containing protein [Methylobacterium sp. 2A]MWV23333.1 heavy-metal-associated domain-containing protein [Methylobacterium sp. 2A]